MQTALDRSHSNLPVRTQAVPQERPSGDPADYQEASRARTTSTWHWQIECSPCTTSRRSHRSDPRSVRECRSPDESRPLERLRLKAQDSVSGPRRRVVTASGYRAIGAFPNGNPNTAASAESSRRAGANSRYGLGLTLTRNADFRDISQVRRDCLRCVSCRARPILPRGWLETDRMSCATGYFLQESSSSR